MRGTGEGHRPYEPVPNGTMTNGSASRPTVASVDGSTMVVKYKDGEKKIVVPPDVPIVRYEIGNKSDLTAGARFTVLAATKKPRHTGGKPHQRRPRRRRAAIVAADLEGRARNGFD
jgi:hypothetical protein